MEIIKESIIKGKSALATTFSKGNNIFNNDNFSELLMTKVGENSVEFSTDVFGSGHNIYDVSVELENNNGEFKLKDYYCSCPAFDSYGGFCKHLVAVCLEINYEHGDEDVVNFIENNPIGKVNYPYNQDEYDIDDEYDIEDSFNNSQLHKQMPVFRGAATASGRTFSSNNVSPKRSSQAILNAMSNFAKEERKKYCDDVLESNVVLEPIAYIENNTFTVEWKIGKDRMYVVKNIENLVTAIKKNETVKYGKNLEFVHRREAFTEQSKKYIDYFMTLSYPLNYGGYYSFNDKRYLNFYENSIDSFIDLIKGRTISAYVEDNSYKIDLEVVDEDVRLPVYIKGKGNMCEITLPEIQAIKGIGKYYIFYNKKLYCCSKKFCDRMNAVMPMLTTVNRRYIYGSYYNFDSASKNIELYEQDYQTFSYTLLPIMERYMNVYIDGVDFSKYEKEEGKYEVYLDIEKDKGVVCSAKAIYGDKEHYLTSIAGDGEAYRDLQSEYKLRSIIRKYFPVKASNNKSFILNDNDELLADLVEYGIKEIEQHATVYASDEFSKIKVSRVPKITTGLSIKGDLLNVSWNLDGMTNDELNDILDSYRRKKKYHRLKSGELLSLKDEGLEFLNELQEDFRLTNKQIKNGAADLPMYRAMYLDALVKENSYNIYVSKDSMFENLISSFDKIKEEKFQVPMDITADLRPYQVEGFKWAKVLAKLGFGGILADDMGLGKTLQMIAFLDSENSGHSLVVCPASLVYNWESEFNRFAPKMKVCPIVGNANERKNLIDEYKNYDVIITSYDLLKRDISYYSDIKFQYEIIDEAQYIKNPAAQTAKAVKAINSSTRFALTGTPIENRLSELWSIFEYLMPGYLFTYKAFKETFEEKIVPGTDKNEKDALGRLHKMISPFILRRLKKDVLRELPEKIEEVIYAKFEDEQEKIYKAAEKNVINSLRKTSAKDFNEKKLQILTELTRLRQLCCDPSLVVENYNKTSAKLTACVDLVENGVSNGHRILLFSQFTTMLDLLEKKMEQNGIKVFMLTGSTSKKKRRELVERFQEGEADVFLISLKAGGTGLNLTAADIVIHYDPWWNVAAQNQATDRAHRIGQENTVNVIKLIAKNSIEERILKLQDRKKELADKIISGENTSLSSFSKEELLELFE